MRWLPTIVSTSPLQALLAWRSTSTSSQCNQDGPREEHDHWLQTFSTLPCIRELARRGLFFLASFPMCPSTWLHPSFSIIPCELFGAVELLAAALDFEWVFPPNWQCQGSSHSTLPPLSPAIGRTEAPGGAHGLHELKLHEFTVQESDNLSLPLYNY